MTKISILISALVFIVIFLVAGCASMQGDVEKTTQASISAESSSCPEAGAALKEGKYGKLQKYLSPEMREQITEKNFDELRNNLLKNGEIRSVEFITVLAGKLIQSEIWKIRMVKNNERKNPEIMEKILRLMIGNLDGRRQIVGLMIQ